MTGSQVALVPFSALTLLVTTTVAALPVVLAARPVARQPISATAASNAATMMPTSTPLVVIRTAHARWLVNGTPVPERELERQLQAGGKRLALYFLPSPALPAGEVRRWLLWLGQRSGASVTLTLPPGP